MGRKMIFKSLIFTLTMSVSFNVFAEEFNSANPAPQFGENKEYRDIGVVEQYASFGAESMIEILDDLSEDSVRLKSLIDERRYEEGEHLVGQMMEKARSFNGIRERTQEEVGSIFRNFFNPGTSFLNDSDIREIYQELSEPYEAFYNSTFRSLGSFSRRIEDVAEALDFYQRLPANMSRDHIGVLEDIDGAVDVLDARRAPVQAFLNAIE